ncbi:MAG TPA: site-specific DNA-methyltransferase [Burkholderiales bacterium]|nr:site-specific DNA-methyltransferase [Burkholderiales bacterium]
MKQQTFKLKEQKGGKGNFLYYGDNLTIMRNLNSASVDLIYLDPPFNSQRNYNLIYEKLTGHPVPEQEEAFCDAWEMDAEKVEMARKMPIVLREYGVDQGIVDFWMAWIAALRNTQPRLLAYLIYMSYRLLEMRRILRPTGSLYLHCDPIASHYIKVILDGVFGHNNFRSEIIWKRSHAHNSAKRWGPVHDVILFYTKSDKYTWNKQYQPYEQSYIDQFFKFDDADGRGRYWTGDLTGAGTRNGPSGEAWRGFDVRAMGRHWAYSPEELDRLDKERRIYWPVTKGAMPKLKRYLNEAKGIAAQDVLLDVPSLQRMSAAHSESLGYQTQKPIGLLTRIIGASTNDGDVVFDPFCGCGTAIYAAHILKRKWMGCDIAILSVRIVRDVLLKRYGLRDGVDYQVDGVPLSVDAAQELFDHDPRQFQHWSVELAGGFASTRHAGDLGVDGRIYFETKEGLRNMVLSVKGGKLTPAFVRELRGVVEREEDSLLAGLICLQQPTKGMGDEAAKAGMFTYQGKDYPRLQIRTIDDLLAGKAFDTPSRVETLSWEKQAALPL